MNFDADLSGDFYDFYQFNAFILNYFSNRFCRDMQIDKELSYVVDEIDFSQFFAISKPYDEEK
ncbi:hypothetical protein HJ121_15515 [Vibrio parahaemolyticus]|nr:hypothetical protein [Vibrio parahaemolyticus]